MFSKISGAREVDEDLVIQQGLGLEQGILEMVYEYSEDEGTYG